jgi:hypothetical protein
MHLEGNPSLSSRVVAATPGSGDCIAGDIDQAPGTAVFTLPVGYRPGFQLDMTGSGFTTRDNVVPDITIRADGTVLVNLEKFDQAQLDGVTFRADQ